MVTTEWKSKGQNCKQKDRLGRRQEGKTERLHAWEIDRQGKGGKASEGTTGKGTEGRNDRQGNGGNAWDEPGAREIGKAWEEMSGKGNEVMPGKK
jgi:hypothetical protein